MEYYAHFNYHSLNFSNAPSGTVGYEYDAQGLVKGQNTLIDKDESREVSLIIRFTTVAIALILFATSQAMAYNLPSKNEEYA
jgi:YD repeat-containing protein